MPLYAYKCDNCGHVLEVRQRFSEDPLTVCPQCDGSLRRLISSVGIVFKGSGFYVTDNRGQNGAPTKRSGVADTSSADTDSSTKSTPATADSTADKSSSSSTTASSDA